MKKRILLMVVVILLILAVPVAMANHCRRCRPGPTPGQSTCTIATGTLLGGYEGCYVENGSCITFGAACPPHTAAVTPLAAEYRVASVERLDEPKSGAGETTVAAATVEAAPSTR
ncbi:MAG TPA: hypothetical protein VEO54_08345 [Thermoanaerobaculia bacterium]|nr:hypothetical protein [Thermoanaerobaculia bacterium]